jgi:hypothetical protein
MIPDLHKIPVTVCIVSTWYVWWPRFYIKYQSLCVYYYLNMFDDPGFVLSCYVSLCSVFRVVISVTISAWKRYSVRLYLQLSCLITLFVLVYILCCIFVLFVLILCTLCCQFLWIVHFWLPLRYSLAFIYSFSGLPIFDWPLLSLRIMSLQSNSIKYLMWKSDKKFWKYEK